VFISQSVLAVLLSEQSDYDESKYCSAE